MMRISLIIFLVGISYSAVRSDRPGTTSRPNEPIVSKAQQHLDITRQLKRQIRQWQTQADHIKPQEIEQILKEVPDVGKLDIMVGANWDQVTKLLNGEMKNRQRNRWTKVYIGRHLVALLNRASGDNLAKQTGLLASAFVSTPDPIRELPEPKEDAKNRNAQDEQIVLTNRAVEVLRRDLITLLLKNSDRNTYLAVIKKLHRQLIDTDASFVGTVEALEGARLDKLDVGLAKLTLNRLGRLVRRFAKPRQYTVYTEVKQQQDKRSEFGQIELDFQQVIENTLSKLSERIERGPLRESSKPPEETPIPRERTPGPDKSKGGW